MSDTQSAEVLYEVQDGVAIITLNRPEKMNTFSKVVFASFNEMIARFKKDENAAVCIITANGDEAFSAGFDIEAGSNLLSSGNYQDSNRFELDFMLDDLGGKPVIWAGFGYCVGQGMALAAWADIRIATADTRFSLPEAKIGISAVTLPILLMDQMGLSQATYSLLYGGHLDANWGLRSGFLHEVVDREELLPRALKIAKEMRQQAPLALQAHKKLLWAQRTEERQTVLEKGLEFRNKTMYSQDFVEGINAFLEKRRPTFTGS